MTRADKLIFIFLILFSVVSIIFTNEIFLKDGQKYVIIETDGREYGKYKLGEEKNVKTIEINTNFGYNKIEVYSDCVKMSDSSCKDKSCVRSKEISEGGVIVCLPNRCTVRIETQRGVDGVSY